MGREYSVTADQFRIKDTWEIFFSVLLRPYEPDCYSYQFVHTFSFFCLFKGQFLCQQLFLLFYAQSDYGRKNCPSVLQHFFPGRDSFTPQARTYFSTFGRNSFLFCCSLRWISVGKSTLLQARDRKVRYGTTYAKLNYRRYR